LECVIDETATTRLLPMLFLLYVFAYIDRVNVGIAALQMNAQLGFGAATFGFGAGVFFLGYALFEVPSNLILVRVGPRRWLARIAITWGLLACATSLVYNAPQFYAARLLLGVAEAGLFPGVIYYLSHWFPEMYRARAIAGFVLAIPLAQTVAGPLSGALLKLAGVGHLAGWQWVFLIEGLPSVLIGVAVLRYLTEQPSEARWLSTAQRTWLTQCISDERHRNVAPEASPLRALMQPLVWALVVPYFAYYTFALAFVFWTPTLVRDALHTSDTATANVTGAIALLGAVGLSACGNPVRPKGRALWSRRSRAGAGRCRLCRSGTVPSSGGTNHLTDRRELVQRDVHDVVLVPTHEASERAFSSCRYRTRQCDRLERRLLRAEHRRPSERYDRKRRRWPVRARGSGSYGIGRVHRASQNRIVPRAGDGCCADVGRIVTIDQKSISPNRP
jgi:MFS family permease